MKSSRLAVSAIVNLLGVCAATLIAADRKTTMIVLPVTVTSALPVGPIPVDVEVNFAAVLRKAKLPGVFDPNSVEVTNLTTGKREPHAISPHVAY